MKKESCRFRCILLVLAIALIVLLMQSSSFLSWDLRMAELLNNYYHNAVLLAFFGFISNYASGSLTGIVLVSTYLLYRRQNFAALWFLLVSGSIGLIGLYVKLWTGRMRPFLESSKIEQLSYSLYSDYSFPSLHSMYAFFIAGFLVSRFKLSGWKKWALYLLAMLVAFTRVYLGVHYVSDVVAGALLGVLVAHLAEISFKQILSNH